MRASCLRDCVCRRRLKTFADLITHLVASGATAVFALDGGESVAIAHRDRQGNNLAVRNIPGDRHSSTWWLARVNNYVVVDLSP
jgi:hypothetical protein